MNIGFYSGNIYNTKISKKINVGEFLNYVKFGTFKALADKVARAKTKKERQELKAKTLPYVTVSGVFSERKESGLLGHSGVIAVDLDNLEDIESTKSTLSNDPYTLSIFKSVSGLGLCVIIQITTKPENHKGHFRWIEKYYFDTYGLVIDAACKDVSRPRYISSDPDIIIKSTSKKAGKLNEPAKTSRPKTINYIATSERMGRIVTDLQEGGHNIAESYEDYFICAMAIADGYGEEGRDFFHIVAQMSSKYNSKQADRKYDNALKTRSGKIKIGSFFYLCKQAGIEIKSKQEAEAFTIARNTKRMKSDVKGAIATGEAMGLSTDLITEVANKVFERDDIELKDSDTPLIEQIGTFVKMNTELRRNVITRNIEDTLTKKLWDNLSLNSIYIKCKAAISDSVKRSDVDAFVLSDQTKEYHPIKEWVKEHRHLPDKPEIIDELIDLLPVKYQGCKKFVRAWLIGLPATVNQETVRLVLTLIGGQETGKTEWYRTILPEDLYAYYAESNLMTDKDDAQLMSSNLIVCDDEMGGKSKKDAQKFKELTSKEFFNLREPYGKGQVTLKRLALLCGTTNDFQVISDSTGNTRILPVEILSAYDFKAHNELDKDQLFMELFRAYERGESWKLDKESKQLLKEINSNYSVMNVEGELLDKYLRAPISDSDYYSIMTATDIKIFLEKITGHRFMNTAKLGVIIKRRFPSATKQINGSTRKGYKVVEVDDGNPVANTVSNTTKSPF